MPKFKLSEDVQKLNPQLGKEVSVSRSKQTDKKHLFIDTWLRYAPEGYALGYGLVEEYKFAYPDRQFRADFCFRRKMLIIEVDGGEWMPHGGRHSRDSDREKENLCAELGYRVMHFSPKMLKDDPLGCIETVVRALRYEPD